jgi:hypothetical protein
MSFGFTATNNSGQVLVSSDTKNLHFVGKATFNRIIKSTSGYGGLVQYAFHIACNATPMPFFTMPTADRYAISAIRTVSGNVWEIELIRSGSAIDPMPEIYVFSEASGVVAPPSTNYGVVVKGSNGVTPMFDSRLGPLVVTNGFSVAPPLNPIVGAGTYSSLGALLLGSGGLDAKFCRSDASYKFAPNNANVYSIGSLNSKPIFFYPSVAQCNRTSKATREESLNLIIYSSYEYWESTYWTFYRGGISYSGTTLSCGWISCEWGCNYIYRENDRLLGIGIDNDSGTGGKWPYSNETLNLQEVPVIVGNGATYD